MVRTNQAFAKQSRKKLKFVEVLVLPQQQQKWSLVCDQVLAKSEKASGVWLEDVTEAYISLLMAKLCVRKHLVSSSTTARRAQKNAGVRLSLVRISILP